LPNLAARIENWATELGFSGLGISVPHPGSLARAGARLAAWVAEGRHGEMDYMARNQELRTRPDLLIEGVRSIISVTLDYWPEKNTRQAITALADPRHAYISRYALGRDYHKTLRQRLQALAKRIETAVGTYRYRVFTDSAPVLEIEHACQGGLGWRGKHGLLLSRHGSLHFVGEIYTDLPLPASTRHGEHCGSCVKCLHSCPTGAIIEPYTIDPCRCISYLTIEFSGSIPEDLRPLFGNRIYGCDDCQLICPWNRRAAPGDTDFAPRHGLDTASLAELMRWEEKDFDERLQGSPIRRIGHVRWLRNIAVALGNGPGTPETWEILRQRSSHSSPLVREHVAWALARFVDLPGGKIRAV
jgi:epoxyqueuosine reductase